MHSRIVVGQSSQHHCIPGRDYGYICVNFAEKHGGGKLKVNVSSAAVIEVECYQFGMQLFLHVVLDARLLGRSALNFQRKPKDSFGRKPLTSASRILPWLVSEWGYRCRRLSRGEEIFVCG
jgi:hypothetical protein